MSPQQPPQSQPVTIVGNPDPAHHHEHGAKTSGVHRGHDQDHTNTTTGYCIEDEEEELFLGCSEFHYYDNDGRLSEKAASKVARYATTLVKRLEDSPGYQRLQQQQQGKSTSGCLPPIHTLSHSELELGQLLGQGAFSDVFEIKRTVLDHHRHDDSDGVDRAISADRCVVKVLRNDRNLNKPSQFAGSAFGLAKEGAILSALNHEHIIHIIAKSQCGVATYSTGRTDAVFLVLDKLNEVLKDRLVVWKMQQDQDLKHTCFRRRYQIREAFLAERLRVAVELASAVAYLHEHRIIHRDLKPANVGFDINDKVKLFDFDVSRILPPDDKQFQAPCTECDDGEVVFRLTNCTGTQRYMSPEVGLCKPYNCKADVFSYSLVLYEMLSLERPFENVTHEFHSDCVFYAGIRPGIHQFSSWPAAIKHVLQTGWADSVASRPTMKEIHSTLSQVSASLQQKKRLLLEKQEHHKAASVKRKKKVLSMLMPRPFKPQAALKPKITTKQ